MSRNFFNFWKLLSMFKTVSKNYKKKSISEKKVGGHDDQHIVNTGGQYSFIDGH